MEVKFDDAELTFFNDTDSERVQIPPETVKAYLRVGGSKSAGIKEHRGICTIRG
jgi:hypothetical protein